MNAVSQTLIEHEPTQPLRRMELASAPSVTPMDMIDRALASNATPETLERLLALQERWEASQARKAFDEAMAAAKAEIPVIAKNRKVGYEHKSGGGETNYRHEDLGEIARTVDPILSKHGLSYRFRTTSEPNQPVSVTCIVSHRLGHFEQNTLVAGRDDSGKKNSIQAIGSTITYLQRYTLKAALGLAASADDDGGKADETDEELITEEQVINLRETLESVGGNEARFCTHVKVGKLSEIRASEYQTALNLANSKARRQ